MKVLVTGISGYIGAAIVPRLQRDGHEVIGLTRDRRRVEAKVPIVEGDVLTGAGLRRSPERGRGGVLPDPFDGALGRRTARRP